MVNICKVGKQKCPQDARYVPHEPLLIRVASSFIVTFRTVFRHDTTKSEVDNQHSVHKDHNHASHWCKEKESSYLDTVPTKQPVQYEVKNAMESVNCYHRGHDDFMLKSKIDLGN